MRARTSLWFLAASFTVVGCSSATGDAGNASSVRSSLSTASDVVAARSHTGDGKTRSPIKHVIVIIGENRTFDHLFATYKPKNGETIDNLLSKKIIKEDGTPWPELRPGESVHGGRLAAERLGDQPRFEDAVRGAAAADGAELRRGAEFHHRGGREGRRERPRRRLLHVPDDRRLGLASGGVDTRIANVNSAPPGAVPAHRPAITDDDYAGSPVHRFYQMWQQLDCNVAYATLDNPSGCLADLFPWVETDDRRGEQRQARTRSRARARTRWPSTTWPMATCKYTKPLADEYTISDNYHQAVQGGTGANHVAHDDGRRHLVLRRNGQRRGPPQQRDREPGPGRRARTTGTRRTATPAARTASARTRRSPGVGEVESYLGSLSRPVEPELRSRPLLPPEQLLAGLLR